MKFCFRFFIPSITIPGNTLKKRFDEWNRFIIGFAIKSTKHLSHSINRMSQLNALLTHTQPQHSCEIEFPV